MKNTDSLVGIICQATGMTSKDLCVLTGSRESTISRYHKGTRSLPTQPLLKMVKVLELLNAMPPAEKQSPSEKEKTELLEKAAWCLAQCYPLQKELDAMQLAEKQAATLLSMIGPLLAEEDFAAKENWIEVMRYDAEKKLTRNGWLAQKELSIKIALLVKEAELYEEAVASEQVQ